PRQVNSSVPAPEATAGGWSCAAAVATRLLFVLGRFEQLVHVGPELLPDVPFRLGQLGQRLLVPHTGQVGSALPVLERLSRKGPLLRAAVVDLLDPRGQIGAQPLQGLLAPAGTLLVVEPGGVFTHAATGRRCGAGCTVAVAGPEIPGEFWLGGERLLVEAGGSEAELFPSAELCEFHGLGGPADCKLVPENLGQPAVKFNQTLTLADP